MPTRYLLLIYVNPWYPAPLYPHSNPYQIPYHTTLSCPLPATVCYSSLALQRYSTQQYPLSHPSLSRPAPPLYPTVVYSLAWREHWHVWSTKQIPQQASLFPAESMGLGGMLTLHYSTQPRTQCPHWTTRLYLSLLGSRLCLFLSPSPFSMIFSASLPLTSPSLPPSPLPPPRAHMCDRQNIRITVWADMVTWC